MIKQKIVHVITGLNDGGAEGVLARLCLKDTVNAHYVISLTDMGKYGPILQRAGISVYCLNIKLNRPNPLKVISLYRLINHIHPEIVQTWMYHADFLGGIVARLCGVEKIFWGIRHSNLSYGTVKLSTYCIMKICGLISDLVPRKIITCSNAAIISHAKHRYSIEKFVLIHNGYDISKFKPFEDFEEKIRFTSRDVPLICMVARYDIQKDHANLIRALSILKQNKTSFHLILVGKNMDMDNTKLVQLISESSLEIGNDITLFGQYEDMPKLMNSIDLHVLSSLGEAFPNVLAEAMACGTPCVSTNVGDAKDIIAEYGWLVPSMNSRLLADAIESALNEFQLHPDLWRQRSIGCTRHIQKYFSIGSMIHKYHEVWNE